MKTLLLDNSVTNSSAKPEAGYRSWPAYQFHHPQPPASLWHLTIQNQPCVVVLVQWPFCSIFYPFINPLTWFQPSFLHFIQKQQNICYWCWSITNDTESVNPPDDVVTLKMAFQSHSNPQFVQQILQNWYTWVVQCRISTSFAAYSNSSEECLVSLGPSLWSLDITQVITQSSSGEWEIGVHAIFSGYQSSSILCYYNPNLFSFNSFYENN